MNTARALLLDNEAVQVLRDPLHAKHRRVLAHIEATFGRQRRGHEEVVLVPTAVRVEAAWNRTDGRATILNRLRAVDQPLDAALANVAATIVGREGVSVADAHIGAVAQRMTAAVVVLTSDPADIRRAAAPTSIVAIRV